MYLRTACLSVLALGLSASLAAGQPVTVKLGHIADEKESIYANVLKPWVDAVTAESQGTVKVEVFLNGTLGRSIGQQAQLMDSGVQDMAMIIPGLSPGRFPDNTVLEMPGLFKSMRESTLVYTALVAAGKLRGYDDFVPIGVFTTPPFNINLKKEIKSLDELKGLKIRAGNPTEAAMIRELGAVPVVIPVTEVPEALGRGTIDGTTAQPQTLIEFGISRVTNFHYMTPLGTAPLTELLSRKVFNTIAKPGQDAILKYSGRWFADRYVAGLQPVMDGYMNQLRGDPKRAVVDLSPADEQKWTAAAQRVIDIWVAREPGNAALLASVKAEIAKVRDAK